MAQISELDQCEAFCLHLITCTHPAGHQCPEEGLSVFSPLSLSLYLFLSLSLSVFSLCSLSLILLNEKLLLACSWTWGLNPGLSRVCHVQCKCPITVLPYHLLLLRPLAFLILNLEHIHQTKLISSLHSV